MDYVDYFDAGVRNHPAAVCFTELGGRSATYAQIGALSSRMARGLRDLGLRRGFHAAVLGGNTTVAFTATLAIARAEGVRLPITARNSVAGNTEFLSDMDCEVLLYEHCYAAEAAEIRAQAGGIGHFICLDASPDFGIALESLIAGQSDAMFSPAFRPDALAAIVPTGGTTGRSKGVMLSHRNLTMAMANQMASIHVTHGMTVLAAAPITHAAGFTAHPFFSRGARIVLMDAPEPQKVLQAIQDERVNFVFLPPTLIYKLLAQPNIRDFDLSSLRYLLYGAAPMSPDKLREALDVFGPVMLQMFGQSEVPGNITVLMREEHFVGGQPAPRQRLLSAGRPAPHTRVAIVDDAGAVHNRSGVTGEVVCQGDIVMMGYYKNPEATREAQVDGWHRTGDVGYFDESGYLYLVDRKKDMIVTGGFNVFSSEVEAAVMAHPAVKDCAVIGVPDPTWGEAVKAVIELRPGQTVSVETLIAFTKELLGSVKAPKSIDIVEQLPRSAVGKVLKKDLRSPYWAGQVRAI